MSALLGYLVEGKEHGGVSDFLDIQELAAEPRIIQKVIVKLKVDH